MNAPRRTLEVVALAAFAAFAACILPLDEDGKACESSEDCDELECVDIEGDGVCLPIPEDRAPATCTEDSDCATALFPVEAFCVGGLCQCDEQSCDDGGTFDVLVCDCVERVSEFCAVDDNCARGLHCEDERCQTGDEPGEPCSSAEPREGSAVRAGCFCPVNEPGCSIGVCFADTGDACDDRVECFSEQNCVNGVCSFDQGFPGDTCTADEDCIEGFCDVGTCP